MNKSFKDLIYLCSCAVNGQNADTEVVNAMDPEVLFKAARYHTLTAAAAYALESAGISNQLFTEAKEKAIRKNLFLDVERKKLFKYFEESGIWYMPLKGTVLKDIYPKAGMRQMADNDILFDAAYQENVRDYFISQKYEVISYDKGNHDVYEKPPVLNFEMHTSLFGKNHDDKWYKYYSDIKERLIGNDDSTYGYHFSDEDFYIYITTHECKHHSGSGTGIRSLLDCYVYLKNKSETLDWTYIENECIKLGIAEFEKQSRELAFKVFGNSENSELTEADAELLEHYLSSGTYGTLENSLKTQMKKFSEKTGSTSKFRFILSKLFPDMEYYQSYYPFFYRYRVLIPFFLVFRTVRGIIRKRKNIFYQLSVIGKTDINEK